MRNVLQQLAELPCSLFQPDLRRREEVVRFLSERPALTQRQESSGLVDLGSA